MLNCHDSFLLDTQISLPPFCHVACITHILSVLYRLGHKAFQGFALIVSLVLIYRASILITQNVSSSFGHRLLPNAGLDF